MERDARKMRDAKPFTFTNLKTGQGVEEVTGWVLAQLSLPRRNLHEAATYVRPVRVHSHS
jgi:urease accessory protein